MATNNNILRFSSLRNLVPGVNLEVFRYLFCKIHDFLNGDELKSIVYCRPDCHIMKCSCCNLIICNCDKQLLYDLIPIETCILCYFEREHSQLEISDDDDNDVPCNSE